jgi:hypothetical protein
MQQHGLQDKFFKLISPEKYILSHIVFLFSRTTGRNCILNTILRSYYIKMKYVELFFVKKVKFKNF